MNTGEYIESGILEAYVLGVLTADENLEVAAYVAMHPELSAELDAIESALIQYSASGVSLPQVGVSDKIWKTINPSAPLASASKNVPLPAPQKNVQWRYAAIWIVLAGSLALNLLLWNIGRKNADTAIALTKEVACLHMDQQLLTAQLDDYLKAKDMMADTAMQTIVMHTMQKGHPMAATLYWSKEKAEAYVSVDGLPKPPEGMQYQLWVIQDGKPVDMGVLSNKMANTPKIQKVAMAVSSGEAFAITLEKNGGSPVPTMENLYVLGKA